MTTDLSAAATLGDIEGVGPFQAAGYRFRFRSNLPDAVYVLDRLFSAFHDMGSGNGTDVPPMSHVYDLFRVERHGERPLSLLLDGSPIQRAASPGSMLDWVISDIGQQAVATAEGTAVIHASAASVAGRALIMPAPPDHGKTTTVAALVRAGWGFLTDEAVFLGLEDLLVHPFPRPLMVAPSSMAALPGLRQDLPRQYDRFRRFEFHVAPEDLRPGCVSRPTPVSFVVFPTYVNGSPTALMHMSRAEALMELVKDCFNLSSLGQPRGLQALARVVREAACYRLSIGAIEPAVDLIRGLFEEDASEAAV